jgi:hypothetical protein
VQINMVPKSGGNTFSLNGVATGTNGNHRANLDDELQAGGDAGPSVKNIYDFGVGVGGPIVQNKLWFYGRPARGASIRGGNYYNRREPLSTLPI